MSTGLADVVKRAALEVIDSNKPTDLRLGTVISINPLRIQITSKLIIPQSMLIVPKHLSGYEIPITITVNTDENNDSSEVEKHIHKVTISETIKMPFGLQIGHKVALLRQQGGQFYYILDRI